MSSSGDRPTSWSSTARSASAISSTATRTARSSPSSGRADIARLFPIPAVGALGAGISGCADPIVGDWLCAELNGRDMPYVFEDEDDGVVYSYSYSVSLKVWPDLGAQVRFRYQIEPEGGEGGGSYGYVLRAEIVLKEGRSYLIDFDYDELDCALTELSGGSTLECEAVKGDTLTFEEQEG